MKKYIQILIICLVLIAPLSVVSAPDVVNHEEGGKQALESKLDPKYDVLRALLHLESGGNCDAVGKSGETGCLQYLPSTWRLFSEIVFGEVVEQTYENEIKVAAEMIDRWLTSGKTAYQIFLMWNQGNDGPCSSGVNKYGVPYDSCAYAQAGLALLSN